MDQENVSTTLTIAVPAVRVFAVLADPVTHSSIDDDHGTRRVMRNRR